MSQVTKPIALDETLQDVVTAIQGITQGGMIVSTGNVGSSTQPVYINGGVPTPIGTLAKANGGTGNTIGKGESVNINSIGAGGDVNIDTYTTNTMATTHFDLAPGSAGNVPSGMWAIYQTMSGSGTGGDYATQMAWGVTNDEVWFRRKKAGTWQPWHEIYGISTGTPTNINSYLTATRTEVHRSGNVVHVNLKFTILSGWSNTASTQICKLPWLPTTSYPWLSRMAGPSTDSSDHYMSSSYIDTAGYICLGEGPYTALTAGNSIWVYGTYLTNA